MKSLEDKIICELRLFCDTVVNFIFYFICDFSGFYDDVTETSDTAFSVESKLFVCIQGALSFELFTSYFWIFFHV